MSKDFSTTFTTDQSAQKVYEAINNVAQWWPGTIEGPTHAVGDEFVYRYKEFHYSRHKVTELIPGKHVVWQITDSRLSFAKDQTEWTGTQNIFEISEQDGKTHLRFTHAGLVPDLECYKDCSNAWTEIIRESLYSLVTTGKGKMELFG
jgi:Activator of Hsp90 ATPase homolog 1-like protein